MEVQARAAWWWHYYAGNHCGGVTVDAKAEVFYPFFGP